MIKYKIKHKIVNCENTGSVTSHELYPLPCHKLSHFIRPLLIWSVTYFMDGFLAIVYFCTQVRGSNVLLKVSLKPPDFKSHPCWTRVRLGVWRYEAS